MKTVLHIITGLGPGGAEAVLYRLVSQQGSNWRAQVVSLGDEGVYGAKLRDQGVPVYCLEMPQGRVTPGGLIKLFRLIRDIRPNVVQTWMYHADVIGGVVGRFAGVQNVVWGVRASRLVGAKANFLPRVCALLSGRIPARIVSCSLRAQQVHVTLGYPSDKFHYVPNGYDLEVLKPDFAARITLRAELGIPLTSPVIGMVARWDPHKDHANLFSAMRLLWKRRPDVRLVCVGKGMIYGNAHLRQLVTRSGGEGATHLVGSRNDIRAVMNALDIHVLSSVAEGFPNTVAEAMACGTPCVVTDVGDAAEIVGATGWVVRPSDSIALSEALLTALESLEVAGKEILGGHCRKRIDETYRLDRMVERYHCVWAQLDQVAGRKREVGNIDTDVVDGFGDEWSKFDQSGMETKDRLDIFADYFHIFPFDSLLSGAEGFDLGCGSGRWAKTVAPRVGKLNCIDASSAALEVAKKSLAENNNCSFFHASVDAIPLPDNSQDFGYALGVLHHVPDPLAGIKSCTSKLKPGAPFLIYLYYAFDNRPFWFKLIWRASESVRLCVSRFPLGLRYAISQVIAALIYWPLARFSLLLEKIGFDEHNVPLRYYRNLGFYVMRTDALDRFGTRLERRFSQQEIFSMLEAAGLERIQFSDRQPFWCAVGYRSKA